ncbi:hypothetical protein G6F31_020098 [Rhizopus arrhizus]|nr:hypothetical protein G6F31_020098 [Rhizopus arrhizus]
MSKQVCVKPVATSAWRLADVAAYWDELVIRSYIVENGEKVLYQEGPLSTLRTPQALRKELEQIRRQGYAEDREENEKDIFCFGCAITDKQGMPVACVSLSIPAFRMSANREVSYIKPLVDTCAAISRKLAMVDFSG